MPPLLLASCLPAGFCVTPVVAPPPPLVLLTCRLCLATSHLRLATCCRLLSASASPLVCLSFAGWFSHHILLCRRLKCPFLTPAFIHTGWLLHLISSRCFHLMSSCQHCRLLMRWRLTSRLPLVRPNWLPVCLTWYAQQVGSWLYVRDMPQHIYIHPEGGELGEGLYIQYVHMQKNEK
jgi:hypothetical protein